MDSDELNDINANPTLYSVLKVEEYIENEGTEENPIVVSDIMDSDVVGCSLSSVKASVGFLFSRDLICQTDVKRKSIRTEGYFK